MYIRLFFFFFVSFSCLFTYFFRKYRDQCLYLYLICVPCPYFLAYKLPLRFLRAYDCYVFNVYAATLGANEKTQSHTCNPPLPPPLSLTCNLFLLLPPLSLTHHDLALNNRDICARNYLSIRYLYLTIWLLYTGFVSSGAN